MSLSGAKLRKFNLLIGLPNSAKMRFLSKNGRSAAEVVYFLARILHYTLSKQARVQGFHPLTSRNLGRQEKTGNPFRLIYPCEEASVCGLLVNHGKGDNHAWPLSKAPCTRSKTGKEELCVDRVCVVEHHHGRTMHKLRKKKEKDDSEERVREQQYGRSSGEAQRRSVVAAAAHSPSIHHVPSVPWRAQNLTKKNTHTHYCTLAHTPRPFTRVLVYMVCVYVCLCMHAWAHERG
jgi:hypothetical protein